MLRQLTEDFRDGSGGGLVSFRFQEKVMSHYIQYKLSSCREQLTVYRQNYKQTDRVNCRGASLLKTFEQNMR